MADTKPTRFWMVCVDQVVKKIKSDYTIPAKEAAAVARLYERADGSWEALAKGDIAAWDLLRKAALAYFKRRAQDGDGDDT